MTHKYWITLAIAAAFGWPTLGGAEQARSGTSAELAQPFMGAERAGTKPSVFAGRQEFDVTGAAEMPAAEAAVGASTLADTGAQDTQVGGTTGGGAEGAVGGGEAHSPAR